MISNANHIQIQKLLEGDEDTIRLLYDTLFPKFARYVKKNSGTYSDAEETFHNALFQLIAHAKVSGMGINSTLEDFVFAECKSLWLKELNKKKRELRNDGVIEQKDDSAVPKNEYAQKLRSFMDSEEVQELKETLRTVQMERRVPKLRSKRRRVAFIAAAAAVLFLVSAIGLLFQTEQSADQLYANYYSTNDLPSVITRNDGNSFLAQGANAFFEEDYANALGYFERYEATTEEPEIALHLYKGATLMELERYFAAIEEFEIAIDSDSMDATKGFWFKAMAHLKSGDVPNAKYVLNDIASHVWYYNHEKAVKLLKKLD